MNFFKSKFFYFLALTVFIGGPSAYYGLGQHSSESVTSLNPNTLEAKLKLSNLYAGEISYHAKNGHFTEIVSKVKIPIANNRMPASNLYKVGFASTDEFIKEKCPDCVAKGNQFKAMAYGNLDNDEEYDIWIINSNRELFHLQLD